MLHQIQKFLCYTIIFALLNASFQPLYAVHISSNEPLENSSLEDPHRSRPRLLVLEDLLQEKVKASANGIQAWTPDFITNPLSRVYKGACSWLAATVMDLAPSILAKTPFEIDYANDLNFWQAHFSSALNEMQQEDVTQTSVQGRLLDLQDIVFDQLLSPYIYETGIQGLQASHPSAETVASLETLRTDFKALLKAYPGFVEESFRRDAATHIQNLQGKTPDPQDFMHLLHYYKDITNPLDYKQVLSNTRTHLQQHKKQLNLTVKDYQAILFALNQGTGQAHKEARMLTKTNRQFFMAASSELPCFGEDVFEDAFNSALPTAVKEEVKEKSFSLMTPIKGMARLAYKGMRYAVEHPVQAITIGLATQVAAAAAFRAFSRPTKTAEGTRGREESQEDAPAQENKGPFQAKTSLEKARFSDLHRGIKRAIGDEFQINQNTTLDQGNPSVASLSNGNVLVAWIGFQMVEADIYGRIFYPNGTALSNEFGINQITINDQGAPSTASLINGNAFVAWQGLQTGSCYEVYGRVFFPNGTALSNEFDLNQNTTSPHFNPSVRGFTNGNAFVAWTGNQFGNADIYGRVISPNGMTLSNEFGINQVTTGFQANPSATGLSNGNVFVTWNGDQTGDLDIYGRVFFPNGTALSNEFGINQNTTYYQGSSSVTSLGNGNVFVAWDGTQTGDSDIYGRVFFPNGTALSNEFGINQNTTSNQYAPSVASLTDGNVFVAWQSTQTGDPDIYGRIFSVDGAALSNDFGINQVTTNNQYNPSVASLTNGNAFVAWQGGDQMGDYDIYGRIFTNDTLASLILPSTTGPLTSDSLTTDSLTTNPLTTNSLTSTTQGPTSTTSQLPVTTGSTGIVSTTNLASTTGILPTTGWISTTLEQISQEQTGPSSGLITGIAVGVGAPLILGTGGLALWKYYRYRQERNNGDHAIELVDSFDGTSITSIPPASDASPQSSPDTTKESATNVSTDQDLQRPV